MFQLRRSSSSLKEVCIFVPSLTLQNTLNDVWTPARLMKIATSCTSSCRNSLSNWLEADRDSQVGECFLVMSIEKVIYRNSTKRTAPVDTNCLSLNASVQTGNLLNTPLNQERVTFGHFSQPQHIRYSSGFWQSYWTANVTRYCSLDFVVK